MVKLDFPSSEGRTRVILIGGASHAGKSTLANRLRTTLGIELFHTDTVARHPGRPWQMPKWEVPPHVREHYLTLSPAELLEDVLAHYRRVSETWSEVVRRRLREGGQGLVVEGSAVLPSVAAGLVGDQVFGVWLRGGETLDRRMEEASGLAGLEGEERQMVEAFMARNRLMEEYLVSEAERLGLRVWNTSDTGELVDRIVGEFRR